MKRLRFAIVLLAGLSFSLVWLLVSCQKQKLNGSEKNQAKQLLVYSPHPEDLIEYVVREFRQRTAIQLTVVQAGTGELIEQIKKNQATEPFDVFWGGGVESLETVIDYFTPFTAQEEALIDQAYQGQHRLWNPFSVLPVVIIYNKSLVPEEDWPDSWEDLLKPIFKNRLVIGDPEKQGSAFTILATMLYTMRLAGDGTFSGWTYLSQLLEQLGSEGVVPSSNQVFGLVASGDFYAGVTLENFALALEKTGSNVGYSYPREGTSALPDGVALLKNAKNPEEAKLFINYVLGVDVQKLLFARWQRRSVRLDIENLSPTIRQHVIHYPVDEAAHSRDFILEDWNKLVRFAQTP